MPLVKDFISEAILRYGDGWELWLQAQGMTKFLRETVSLVRERQCPNDGTARLFIRSYV
jgi:hypothetical protein